MSTQVTSAEADRTLVLVCYILHLVGAVAGVTSIIGLVINYLKRGEPDGFFASHHSWMIRSFWWALLWVVIGGILTLVLVGWVILFVAWVWYLYRHVRGLLALINGAAMPR